MTDATKRDPDALLAAIKQQESRSGRGQLKAFLGMSPGVGKTYAMLEAAQRELKAGRNVVIGYLETHGRKETEQLSRNIPAMPRRSVEYRGVVLSELDLDSLLALKPELALIDELAHTNAPGSRHPKRWQDVQELLEAGIDIFTTLNVQHVESRADTVRQITGAEVRETVPDSVLDDAVLEVVDLPPRELVQRLHEGKVYLPDRAASAVQNFFREANLTALRELVLRLVADHVGEDTVHLRRSELSNRPWKTGNRLLVAVGPSPLSESLIRWTRRMADELRCSWIAVHVETSRPLPESAQTRLAQNLEAARVLGAEVLTTTDDDIARGLLRVAHDRNVTQIVLGKPADSGLLHWFRSGRLLRTLMQESGDIDLHVIRAEKAGAKETRWRPAAVSTLNQYLVALSAVMATGLLNLALVPVAGPRVPGLIFLVAVVVLALFVGRGPVLLAGAASALAWNFFFLPPRFTLIIEKAEDALLFLVYFIVALVLGQLVARIRAQSDAERRREERASALYELTRQFAEAGSRDEVVWQLIAQVDRVFRSPATVCLPVGDALSPHPDGSLTLAEKELGVSDWAFRNCKAAGRFTDNLPGASALHLPLAAERKVFGVLAVALNGASLAIAQRDLLEAFARQAALVLDRIELRAAAEQTRLLAESERLGRALLNSISHELRTPLAASTSAASALTANENATPEQRHLLVNEIQEANARLNRVVGNLLDVARLESGKVVPRLDWHDARDVIQTAIRELGKDLAGRSVTVSLPPEPMLARLDFTLLQHAVANLLVNATVHTPPGTPIEVHARFAEDSLIISVADRGSGIPKEALPRIFEKFFRGPNAPTGGSGLGLTIAKGFVEAHGGSISALNRPGGGALFALRIPQPEVTPETRPAA